MHTLLSEAEETLSSDGITIRAATFGDAHFTFESYEREFDTAPFFAGLPNDRCPCPHWGYVLSGRMHVDYGTDEETISADEVFFVERGHTITAEAGTEYITFSPADEFRDMMEIVARNFEESA